MERLEILLLCHMFLLSFLGGFVRYMPALLSLAMPYRCIEVDEVIVDGSMISGGRFENTYTAPSCTGECPKGTVWGVASYASTNQRTMYSTFNLTSCDAETQALAPAAWTTVANAIGGSIAGTFGDLYGRKNTFVIFGMIAIFIQVALIWIKQKFIFILGYGLLVAITMIELRGSVTLVTESLQPKNSYLASLANASGFSVGVMFLCFFHLKFADWQDQFVGFAVWHLLCVILGFVIYPFSPLWLQSKGRTDDAAYWKKQIDRFNSGEGCVPIMVRQRDKKKSGQTKSQDSDLLSSSEDTSTGTEETSKTIPWHVSVRNRVIIKRTLVCSLAVCPIVSFVYQTTYWATSIQQGSPYLNGIIAGALELPSYMLVLPLARKGSRLCLLVTIGILIFLCALLIFIPPGHVGTVIVFWSIRITITFTYCIVYIYLQEIYPTTLRTGCQIMLLPARAFSFFSPLWMRNTQTNPVLFWGICTGGFCLALGAMALLPETKELKLPKNLDDIHEQEKTVIMKCCSS